MTDRLSVNEITSDQLDALYERLRLAHEARRAKEGQLDDIRRALCAAEIIRDDDPYSHADLADVIRQLRPSPSTTARKDAA